MIKFKDRQYKELRCAKCQNFVIYHNISAGYALYQCPACGFVNEWTFKYLKTKANVKRIEDDFQLVTSEGGEK